MSPGKRRRVTFADEASIVTYEAIADQPEGLAQQDPDGKPVTDACIAMKCWIFLAG